MTVGDWSYALSNPFNTVNTNKGSFLMFRLACFGDSLTAGFQTPTPGQVPWRDTPYGGFLQEWLGERGNVIVSGICGEVTHEMVGRFDRAILRHSPHAVVILGGTNDLGSGYDPEAIVENLTILYKAAQQNGIRPVGVTLPSIYVDEETLQVRTKKVEDVDELPEWIRSHIDRRRVLNRMIQDVCASEHISSVDLFDGTSEGPHDLLAPRFSNDGLHLSTAGYERFARLVWEVVCQDQFGPCPGAP